MWHPQLERLEARVVLAGDVIISEFMAANDSTLADEDGAFSDWVEIYNNGDTAVDLNGWSLTDSETSLQKWTFPETMLAPAESLIVFASDKDRAVTGEELHTNFKLTTGGEYLALVEPDGTTISNEYTPAFSEQFADVSFGVTQEFVDVTLIGADAPTTVLVPTDGTLADTWTQAVFDDSTWTSGTTGIGFDTGDDYGSLINLDLGAMQNTNASAYSRVEFDVTDPSSIETLDLNIRYDDGFVAYLNGTEVASRNAPASPVWNSTATAEGGKQQTTIMSVDFDTASTPYTVANYGGNRNSAVIAGGPTGDFLRVIHDGTNSQRNRVSFDKVHDGPSPTVVIDFDFRFDSQLNGAPADGMALLLLPTSVYGDSGIGTDGSYIAEEPNVAGTFAVGFDLYPEGTPTNDVGIYWDGSQIDRVLLPSGNNNGQLDLDQGVFHHARIELTEAPGGSRVTMTLTPDVYGAVRTPLTPFSDLFIPGLTPYESRVELAGRTGGLNLSADVDNLVVQFGEGDADIAFEEIGISQFRDQLVAGTNVLAIQSLNLSASDGDLFLEPQLIAQEFLPVDATVTGYFELPTPETVNGVASEAPAGRVTFSESSRTFSDPIALTLSVPSPTATIRYTTDGLIPTESSIEYTGAIQVSQSIRVRARAFEPGKAPGPVQSESFISIGSTLTNFQGTGSQFDSNLPLMIFDSFGTGDPAGSSTALLPMGGVFIDTDASGRADILGEPEYGGRMGLRIRGQSSQGWPKKQYALEIWDEGNSDTGRISASNAPDKAVSIFGLPAESDWVLNGPYSDKTQLNNFLTFNWYRDIGLYAPRTRIVEVFVNTSGTVDYSSDYRGTYILLEKIKIDDNRVDIPDVGLTDDANNPASITGGYIWKKDKAGQGDVNFNSTRGDGGFKYVEPQTPTAAQRSYLDGPGGFLAKFDAALYGTNFTDPVEGYAKYIDVASWVDTWLMVQMTKQIDGFRLSTYYNKDQDVFDTDGNFVEYGKIKQGPAWDYNLSLSNANYLDGGIPSGFYIPGGTGYPYWTRLFQDPAFDQAVADRWQELRQTTFTTENLMADIDAAVDILTDGDPRMSDANDHSNPIDRNFNRWGTLGNYLWPNCYFGSGTCSNAAPVQPPQTYADYITNTKWWLTERVSWMDDQWLAAPVATPGPGIVAEGTEVTLSSPDGAIFYTTDGTDPNATTILETEVALLEPGAPSQVLVPTSQAMINRCGFPGITPTLCFVNPNYVLGANGETWQSGTGGVGFDLAGDFDPLIGNDVEGIMSGVNASAYIRIPFEVTANDLLTMTSLDLNVRYDDGFAAYLWFAALNTPVEIVRSNAPGASAVFPITKLAFDASAASSRDDAAAAQYQTFDILNRKSYVRVGTNYLIFQALNASAADDDFLIDATISYAKQENLPNPSTVEYTGPITINENTRIVARVFDSSANEWSGAFTGDFITNTPPLAITEINYRPLPATQSELDALGVLELDNDQFEFIEIQNVGVDPLDLEGVTFTDGVGFTFGAMSLGASDYTLVVRNQAAFEARYGSGLNIAGEYTGGLNNDGEHIGLFGALNEPTMDFTYNDSWYPLTDGEGFSLTIIDPSASAATWNDKASWRPSDVLGGSPGSSDSGIAPLAGSLMITEVVGAASAGGDVVELLNLTAGPVAIGDFYFTDDSANLTKFQIPAGTSVPAGGYLLLDQTLMGVGFDLSDTSSLLTLQGATSADGLIGFRVTQDVSPFDTDVSLGNYTNSIGDVDFTALVSTTLPGDNATASVGPVVINEIMYNPATGGTEFLELRNISASPVSLDDGGGNTWGIRGGLRYDFPVGASISAGGYAVLIQGADAGDPVQEAADFRAANSVPGSVEIYVFTPTANGILDGAGENLIVGKPSPSDPAALITVDHVRYSDLAPWPTDPDGNGPSLSRVVSSDYGNDPINWATGNVGGTPGSENVYLDESPPSIPTGLEGRIVSGSEIRVWWNPSVDPESGVDRYNIYRDGDFVASALMPIFTDNTSASAVHTYEITAVNNDGRESVRSDSADVGGLAVTSVSFQEGVGGYIGAIDTELREEDPTQSQAIDPNLEVDGQDGTDGAFRLSALLKWDNLSIPAGNIVVGGSITLNLTNPGNAYEFAEIKQPWTETGATWNEYAAGQPWETAGALGGSDSGSDIGTLQDTLGTGAGVYSTDFNVDGVALLQRWVDDGGTNNGVVFRDPGPSTDGADFDSREVATAANRPMLTIESAEPVAPGVFGDVNEDGVTDGDDLAFLTEAVSVGANDPVFDLDDNSETNQADIDILQTLLGTAPGDANNDGVANRADAVIVLRNFGSAGTLSQGNFSGDAVVGLMDAAIVQSNFTNSPAPAASASLVVSARGIAPLDQTIRLTRVDSTGQTLSSRVQRISNRLRATAVDSVLGEGETSETSRSDRQTLRRSHRTLRRSAARFDERLLDLIASRS